MLDWKKRYEEKGTLGAIAGLWHAYTYLLYRVHELKQATDAPGAVYMYNRGNRGNRGSIITSAYRRESAQAPSTGGAAENIPSSFITSHQLHRLPSHHAILSQQPAASTTTPACSNSGER